MIDFIRLYYRDKSRLECFVLDKENFETVSTVMDYHTGEVKYPYRTKLESMDIGVSERSGYVKNSLHKLHNFRESAEDQNYNDFSFSKLCTEIDYLSKNIIDAERTQLTQLEFGLNIEIANLPELLVRRNFIMHKFKGGTGNTYQGKGELKQFTHENYFIKVYDKGKQFELNKNVLRFELKFIKAKEFQKLGVHHIGDLKDKRNLRGLFNYLINRFNEMTIVDDFDENSITDVKDYNNLQKYTNPLYWTEEIRGLHPQQRIRHKQSFEKILLKNDLLKTKDNLRALLFKKYIHLINH
jgi:hypothetical protein